MADGSLARRYANALVDLAQESGDVDAIAEDLDRFVEILELGDGALRAALNNPGLTLTERKAILDQVLGKIDLRPYTQNFLRLVIDKNRFAHVGQMRREYRALADKIAGRVRATVTTAEPLGEALVGRIQEALSKATGKTVDIQYAVDPELIGGMVAHVGDKVFDASVRSRLNEIQQTLLRESVAGEA